MGPSPGSSSSRPAAHAAASFVTEHLKHDHAAATAGAWRAEVVRFFRAVVSRRCGDVQQFASQCETGLAGGAGEQPIVADAMEATRQDMKQEAADELVGGERDDLLAIGAVATIVLVAEG
ncbi:hypothetical protein MesoLjLb_13810 [Mesorhizobium sp. L-8-3]|nr:hypothetical protein MesoLjLb_13810 [Mesorhizobium sp. L-8-3]